ncbi:Rap1-interacting factor 1 N-terminal-like protein [Elsinoe australis]|uniref:Rap1-interacting factor 1 N-terminal-like protein n=1 Tax=Elsinoe australis TaxID=40998 RepID=A0A4U7B9R0_9PEZI|nr:Rap1-interacting factor 1 N-terminal-like protein [Elsinoe australis]
MTFASSGVFEQAPRPPTPPKDHTSDIEEALEFLNVDYSLDKPSSTFTSVGSGIETPPKSSPPGTTNPSSRPSKKVDFKSYTLQHEGPSPKKESAPLRPLPQTRQAKPLRSILKSNLLSTPTPEEHSSPSGYFSPPKLVSIPKMLASVMQSLASQDGLLRLDGYMTLNNALKAHDNFPTEAELREKVPRIMQCYTLRDLRADTTNPQSKNITTQALNLVNVIFTIPSLAAEVSNEVRNSLLDLSLQAFSQEPVNKAIANRFLYLLATPEFKTRGLSQQKADTLISQFRDIHQRISGNSVVAARLAVYQRLVIQIPQPMLHRLSDWIDHVFHGCLSSNEDICKRAIQCGTEAGLALGTHFSATKAIVDFFASDTENGGIYGDYFIARLSDMASNRKRSPYVPQIWSVIIMFFRNRRSPISQWRMTRGLLLVVQRCLNSADQQTKHQALLAWNRLVFVLGLDAVKIDPPDRLLAMLKVPFTAALDMKTGTEKGGSPIRKTALAGYANLLYYALQPGQSFERMDFFWDEYVNDIITRMLRNGGMDGRYANKILKALFRGSTRAWSSDRALSPVPFNPDELARLDPQWLRSRISKIFDTLERHYGACLCLSLDHSYETSWSSLVGGVAEASAQEVRASMETREALAHIMNFFTKLWTTAQRWLKGEPPQAFISRFGDMIIPAIETFGPNAFLEENLTMGSSDKIEPAPTPSNRTSKHHISLQSPFLLVWKLLASPNNALENPAAISQVAQSVITKMFESQTSAMSRLILLRQCMLSLQQGPSSDVDNQLRSQLSDNLLSSMSSAIRSQGDVTDAQTRLSNLSKVGVVILRVSLHLHTTAVLSDSWMEAFESLAQHLVHSAGGAAVNFGLLEPLATSTMHEMSEMASTTGLQLSILMLSKWTWIQSRQQLERSWKLLEGNTLDSIRKQSLLDKKPDVLNLAQAACEQLMSDKKLCASHATEFIDSLRMCVSNCPSHLLLQSLEQTSSLSILIEDQNVLLSGVALTKLWFSVLSSLKALQHDSTLLAALAPLLVSGLATRHRSVANETIAYWNTTFGQLTDLQYPPRLASVLQRVANHVDLDLPNFPSDIQQMHDQSLKLPVFDDDSEGLSQEETETSELHSDTPRKPHISAALLSSAVQRNTPIRTRLPAQAAQTPKSAAMPPPKLRHDNSQIEFITVGNLPSELTDDGSQGLTEHQKEVRERQQEEANRMFPQFSSSPAPPSTGKNIITDRIAQVKQQDAMGARLRTPEIDAEEQGPMDAFLGSSPSQRSAQRAQDRSSQLNSEPPVGRDDDGDEDMADVPSSPPELTEEFETAHNGDPLFGDVPATVQEEEDLGIPATQQEDLGLDLTSDDPIPTSVKPHEIEPEMDSQPRENVSLEIAEPEIPEDLIESSEPVEAPSELPAATTAEDDLDDGADITSQLEKDSQSVVDDLNNVEVDATRIEDSFVGTSDAGTTLVAPDAQEQAESKQQTPAESPIRTNKRRASQSQSPSPNKLQKKTSPIKKLFSWFGGQSDGAKEENDMEDCIVVASQPEPTTPALKAMDVARSASQPESISQPVKRGRGRPRKTSPSRATPIDKRTPGRSLKRKSSLVSMNSADEPVNDSIASSVASSPRKTRRQTKLQDTKTAPIIPMPKEVSVVVSPKATKDFKRGPEIHDDVHTTPVQDQNAESEEDLITPERQLREEAAAAAARAREERVILSPKSIIGRLKNILVDVKEMGKKFVLGSQEERELNGIIFELGGEVHAAGRREA